jgi:SAM-dependent methyltransferase
MLLGNLIKECSCGNTEDFDKKNMCSIDVLVCASCGTAHQYLPGWNPEKLKSWYENDYHTAVQHGIGHTSYKDRYAHDKVVAGHRLVAYKDFIASGMQGIDIGSSNSAFVHSCLEQDINCTGIEVGKDIGDNAVTVRQPIEECSFDQGQFDFATMHDSLEHMVDIGKILSKVNYFLKSGAHLIIDLPDYFVDAGLHHWRYVQHIWYWNEPQMIAVLKKHGFSIVKTERPIPGKLVFYFIKD